MRYVVDASVAVKWLLGEQNHAKAAVLFLNARAGIDELLVPDFFLAECGHALFRAERRKLLALGEARKLLLALIPDLPVQHSIVPLAPRAAEICQQIHQGFYDCLYVALAEREACVLVTADVKLVAATQSHFPFVLELASLP